MSTDGSVKVTYTKPTTGSANKLVDAASNETATFTDQTVTNNTPAVTVTVPGAPQNFEATAGDAEVTLSWAAPASDGGASITEYEYRHAAGGTVPEGTAWVDVVDGSDDGASAADETGVTISSLTNGTEYAFEVRAVNSVGDGTLAGPVTATPTDKTVTTNEDTAYTFGASDFAFTDTDTGDTLASVTVVTLPTVGTLALDGTDVTAADVVSKADIDDSKLVFTPAPNGNGTGYASFTFKVSDGVSESAAYTLTVNVTAVNDAATGRPAISGTARVGQTLMASTSGIADVDGKMKAEAGDAGFAYTYQWVRVRVVGISETDISGATSDSYVLVAADTSRKVKVKVRFTDDGDTDEGPLTSAAYPSGGTVAAADTVLGVLVSNDGQYDSPGTHLGTTPGAARWALSFRTGGKRNGYDLTGIQLRLGSIPTEDYEFSKFKVSIWSTTPAPDIRPLRKLFDLTPPASPAAGLVTFSTPNRVLSSGTRYVVILRDDNTEDGPTVARTRSHNEDSGKSSGWTISNSMDYTYFDDWITHVLREDNMFKMKVHGLARTTLVVSSPPQNLRVTARDTQVTLNWEAPAIDGSTANNGYEYRYAAGAIVPSNTSWTAVPDGADTGTSAADETGVTISSLINGTEYAFEVRAVGRYLLDKIDGAKAGPVTATPTLPNVPGAPTSFMATAGDSKVDLSWQAPASDGGGSITEYEYRYSMGSTVSASATWTDVPDGSDMGASTADETGVTISNLTNGTEYAFDVRAVNSAGSGDGAGSVTATPVGVVTGPTIWTATLTVGNPGRGDGPPNGYCLDGDDNLDADYGTLSDNDFVIDGTTYTVECVRWGTGSLSSKNLHLDLDGWPGNDVLTWTLHIGSDQFPVPSETEENDEHTIKFKDAYKSGSGNTPPTEGSTVTVKLTGPVTTTTAPDAPTSFMATAGDGEVTLAWTAPASDGGASITEYEYRHAAGTTVPEGTAWVDVVDGSDDGASAADETGVTISSLTNGTQYAFEVRAVNSVGEGTLAGPVTATPAVANSVPTSADKTVTTNEDTAYTFGASDFAFTDTDSGDTLASVTVVTLPTVGTLALDGTDVTAADVVSKADIDDSKLVFTPAANENGTGYASFTFKVSDGVSESASAYTLTINVTALNDAATGQPSITGTATVGRTLMATTSGIADIDGKMKAEAGDAGFAYTYQWVRVASDMTEADISGAMSDSYVLAADDNGKQVKVKVGFTDDGGTDEGPLTSAAYPSGTTVGTNTAPASADKTVTTAEDTAYTFQVSDFAFTDTDTGDTLVSVTVVTLPTVGTLALDGTTVTTDQVVTAAELGDLVFTPAPNGNGTGYASFTFKVSDGVSESAAYTLTVTVTALNDAATGQPSITGTALVGQTLTASTSDIADIDGKMKAEAGDTGFAYTYQWVRVDGMTETDISGETSDSYTLVAADNGKQVKVKVSFTDDGGTDEGPLTSAAYPSTGSVMTPTVTVAAGGEVDEGDDAEFTLTLSAAAPTGGQSVSYSLALTNPNPVADRAHVAAANLGAKTATVGAGETTATVTVATVDVADLVSKNSTLTLSLTAGSGYELGSTAAAEVTIDDTTTATVTYSGGACSATVGEADGRVNLGIQLDKDVAFQIGVLLVNIPASAGAGNDYVAADADGALEFPALTRTSNFAIGITDNQQLEGDEVFDIKLFRNGLDVAVIINTGCTGDFLTVTITDDDTAELSISAPTPVTEGSNIRVTVAPPTGGCIIPFPVTVTLTPSGDTNGLGSADAKSLQLSACTSGTANFATANDSVKTAERSLLFTLSLPDGTASGITLPATPSAAVTVTDDETLKVTGVAVSSTPSSGSTYGAGETLSFTATFNGPVTVTGTPQLPFSLGGVTRQAAFASGSDSTALVFSYTVAAGDNDADGVSWRADSLSLNGGTIKFMTGVVANRVDAALTHAAKTAQSGHKVDTPPVLSTPTVNGAALVLTYNEALDTGSKPASSAFTVKVGGTAVSLATSGAVAVDGKTVTLTLAAAVTASDTVTVSYAVPGSNPLQDAGGTDAPAFTDLAVTNGTGNTAPAFANATAARSFTETVGDAAVATAGNVGAVVTATDGDADTLTYSLEGADAAKFGIVSGSGQIQTRAGEKYDRETKASYAVTVKADDGNGGSDTVAVTITLADAVEIPLAPGMPAVSATSGSTTSLDVSWTAPGNTGRPALSGYKLQYRQGSSGAWTDHAHSGTGTTATIASLTAATAYQVQVRAVNADGDGAWSASGTGTTGSSSNNAPEFSDTATTRSFTETVGDAVAVAGNVGAVVTATDAEGDTLTYTLGGADVAKFDIDSASGQIKTKAGERYDREAKASYSVRVKADDGNSGTDTVAVTISVANAVEIPLAPGMPAVAATSGSTTSLDVRWTAPGNTGRPALSGYKLQYRQGSSGAWTDHPHTGVTTSATIASLPETTAYEVQVRAVNADGDGAWSASGSGTTGSASNNAPEFSGNTTTRSFTETVGDAVATAGNVGAVVTATDAEGDTLTYTLGSPPVPARISIITFFSSFGSEGSSAIWSSSSVVAKRPSSSASSSRTSSAKSGVGIVAQHRANASQLRCQATVFAARA